MTKKCTKCLNIKLLEEFCANKYKNDGLDCWCKKCKQIYYKNNKDKIKLIQKIYNINNKEYLAKKKKEYTDTHKIEKAKYDLIYRKVNKEKFDENKKKWWLKNKDNINLKIKRNLRRRINHVIKDGYKSNHTLALLGCAIEYFKLYLESKFLPGMTWENYGQYGWHIDHIKPCASFDLSKPKEQAKCFHYSNMQPLWWRDNLHKAYKLNKIIN